MPDGTSKTFQGIVVEKGLTDSTGKTWIQVRFADGQSHSIELARVQKIDFGDAGQGRKYKVVVGSGTPNETFAGTTLQRYNLGRFEAIPPEEAVAYALQPSTIRTFDLSEPLAPPVGAAPAPGPEEDLFAQATPAAPHPAPAEDEESGDSSGAGSPNSGPTPAIGGATVGLGANSGLSGKLFFQSIGVLAGTVIILLMSLTTWLWLVIYSFQRGKTGEGIVLIFLCWCFLAKIYYARNYEGNYRSLLQTLIWMELIGSILLRVSGHFLNL